MPTIDLMGGKIQIYQRGANRFWQARTSIGGAQRQFSTKREALPQATKVAEDWYLTLQAKLRAGVLDNGPTFRKAAEQFLKEYGVITEGERSPKWVEGHKSRLRVHLRPKIRNAAIHDLVEQHAAGHDIREYAPDDGDRPAGVFPSPGDIDDHGGDASAGRRDNRGNSLHH